MSIIETLVVQGLPDYELLCESDPEIGRLVESVQNKIGMIEQMGSDYSVEELVASVLKSENREIDLKQSYGRYLDAMKRYDQKPKSKKTFKTSKKSMYTEVLNSPFARFKEIERLGLEEGTRVLFESTRDRFESEVRWITPICLVNIADKSDSVPPWNLTVI